jgi:hypothetical protein
MAADARRWTHGRRWLPRVETPTGALQVHATPLAFTVNASQPQIESASVSRLPVKRTHRRRNTMRK